MKRTMMNKQIREYLFNYSKDLEYWIGNEEVDSINHVTNGTPTFETIEEAETYLRGLEKIIEAFKEEADDGI